MERSKILISKRKNEIRKENKRVETKNERIKVRSRCLYPIKTNKRCKIEHCLPRFDTTSNVHKVEEIKKKKKK